MVTVQATSAYWLRTHVNAAETIDLNLSTVTHIVYDRDASGEIVDAHIHMLSGDTITIKQAKSIYEVLKPKGD